MSKAKTVLYNDEPTYLRFKALEKDLKKVITKLQNICDTSLGLNQIDNLTLFINAPTEYIVNRYWIAFGSKTAPDNADKVEVYDRNNKFKASTISELKNDYDILIYKLGSHAPKITKTEIVYNVQKKSFDKYIDNQKQAHYECLERFLKVSQELRTHEQCSNDISLMKYAPQNLRMDSLNAVINKHNFQQR